MANKYEYRLVLFVSKGHFYRIVVPGWVSTGWVREKVAVILQTHVNSWKVIRQFVRPSLFQTMSCRRSGLANLSLMLTAKQFR